MPLPQKLIELFDRSYIPEPNSGCWLWMGYVDKYGQKSYHGKTWYAHRISYELNHGEIPTGFYVCHKCDTPSCVNPEHLWLGTPSENVQDMVKKNRGNYTNTPFKYIQFGDNNISRRKPEIHYGSNNRNAILDEEKVVQIRLKSSLGALSSPLAKEFGVSVATINRIIRRRTWRHI